MAAHGNRARSGVWLLLVCGLALPATAGAQADEERALEEVRARIEAIEARVARQTAARADHVVELKRLELAAGRAAAELARLERRSAEQRRRQQELAAETRAATGRLDGERERLARQVRLSYMTGREELFKLLLSQESPASLGRMMVYYDYLHRARSARIGAVGEELAALAGLAEQSAAAERELSALREARQGELAKLEQSRAERQRLLADIDRELKAAGNEMDGLRDEESRLAELLIELGEALAAFPVDSEDPFPALRGRLAWPVPGRVGADYGELRAGGPIRWNGVLLESTRGTPVRAVYHGRVAFSDWLPGLGLLIIVDHGDGFMSLYGHNELLLKDSGDWVRPGEVISQVGDSGGQAAPSLYFEIRRHGEPVDPHQWIAGDPAPGG